MNIVLRLSDNVALYAGDVLLTEDGVSGPDFIDPTTTTANAVLTDAIVPDNWTGGAYSYSGGVWTLVDGSLIPKASVPQTVTRKQGKQALVMSGHWAALMAFVNALPEPNKSVALIELDDSETYERQDAFLLQAAEAISLSADDLDQLFTLAASL